MEITAERVIIHGPWGGMPFHALGDGYRGTGSWLLDLLGNNLKAGRWAQEPKLAGIVLLDEMDEHLHPRWQKSLVPTLRRLLPNVQFIATTHSPLAIVNARENELYATQLHNAVAELVPNPLPAPDGRSANEILLGEWFGLESTLDSRSEKLLAQYRKAFQSGDREVMKRLEPDLHERIRSFLPSELDSGTQRVVDEVLQHELAELTPRQRKKLISDASKKMRASIED
jgi:predicted ATP-binding protein involved in virulence